MNPLSSARPASTLALFVAALASSVAVAQSGPVLIGNVTFSETIPSDWDGAVDRCERFTVAVSLRNVGTATATGVSATLSTSTPGVALGARTATYPDVLPDGSPTPPSAPMVAHLLSCVACAQDVVFAVAIRADGVPTRTETHAVRVGKPRVDLLETFDHVSPPALPAGWTTATAGTSPPLSFRSTSSVSATPPNAVTTMARFNTRAAVSELVSAPFTLRRSSQGARLSFRHVYDFAAGFDGAVLEMSIDGAGFVDVLASGATFLSGGYTGEIADAENPLLGRRAWTAPASGLRVTDLFIPLTPAPVDRQVRLRWKAGWGEGLEEGPAGFWWIDDIVLSDYDCGSSSPCRSTLVNQDLESASCATRYYPLAPCRLLDTRGQDGPAIPAFTTQFVGLNLSRCGIDGEAIAVSGNLTIAGATAPGELRVYPQGTGVPLTSSLSFRSGATRANNGVFSLSSTGNGAVNIENASAGPANVILDVNGYFK